MKFRVDRDVMTDAVLWASRTLPSKSTQPLLTGMHLVADRAGVTLTGSDADVSGRATITASVGEPGTVLVPGRLLTDIARSLPSAVIDFAVDGSRVHITCGRSSFTLPTMPVAEYPAVASMPEISGTVEGSQLAAAIAQVAVAASRDETLPAFTGIKADVDGSTITFAATDRYRLAMRELQWSPNSPSIDAHALIPARFLADTSKSLATSPTVGMAFTASNESIFGIEGEGRQSTSRLLAADFPKYQSLLPSESTAIAQVSTSALIDAVKRVSLVLDRDAAVKVHFSDGEVQVSGGGSSSDVAEAREFVEGVLGGDDITISFNHQFLLDGLHAIDAPTAVVSMTTPGKPAVITGASEVDGERFDAFKYLLMPIRQP